MKRLTCMLCLLLAGVAGADELSDANKLLLEKSYDKAFPIYSRLAAAGNREAQFHLGEMYWYGDGTAPDLATAKSWLQKAAAAGHHDAQEDLAALKARETRGADLAYWTTGYKGEDLTAGKFACPAPAIPAVSKTNVEIKEVSAAISTWESCYNGFVANINAAMPLGKRIPDDVAEMMTPHEMETARAHLGQVYAGVIANGKTAAASVTGQRDAWNHATEQYVAEHNRLAEEDTRRLLLEREQAERNAADTSARHIR